MFSALKLVTASAIIALVGAFLLSGILPVGSPDEAVPGAQTVEPATELVTGWVNTEGTDRPAFETRMVITLLDASSPDGEPVPLGEFVLEAADRLEAHNFAIESDLNQIDEDGTYLVDMRLEESSGRQIISAAEEQVPVITHGHPTDNVEVRLVVLDREGPTGLVTGVIMADADLADPDAQARLVISMVEEDGGDPEMAPLGEWVADDITRLRPPRSFALGYDTEIFEESSMYLLQARLEDAETGVLLAAGTQAIADLANADGMTVRLSVPVE